MYATRAKLALDDADLSFVVGELSVGWPSWSWSAGADAVISALGPTLTAKILPMMAQLMFPMSSPS
jgi:hypothetical protein